MRCSQAAPCETTLQKYTEYYRQIREVQWVQERSEFLEHDLARRVDLLSFQINEIESAHLRTGEEEAQE
jgi:DNA repair protein RecN (Recombination protein N)